MGHRLEAKVFEITFKSRLTFNRIVLFEPKTQLAPPTYLSKLLLDQLAQVREQQSRELGPDRKQTLIELRFPCEEPPNLY